MTRNLWLPLATLACLWSSSLVQAEEAGEFTLEGSGETWTNEEAGSPPDRAAANEAPAEESSGPTWLDVRHEVGMTLGPAVALDGLHPAGEAAFLLDVSYFFRIVPAWHVGAFFHFDQFGRSSGDVRRQRQVGLSVAARWGWSLVGDKLEIGVAGLMGYQYLDLVWDQKGHWFFFGLRPRVAWLIYRGLGVAGHFGTRMGYAAGLGDHNHFGATFDFGVTVFWAW